MRVFHKITNAKIPLSGGRACKESERSDGMEREKEREPYELALTSRLSELEICNERYRIVLEQSDIKVFEYSIPDGSLCYCTSFEEIFGIDASHVTMPQSILEHQTLHPDDAQAFQALFEKICHGAPAGECEFRIKGKGGDYSWYRIRIKTIFDDKNTPIRAVGQICDITFQKHELQDLMQKAQHDELTGLLNKAATQQLAENSLKGNSVCALYIIDVDHFKNINDSLGHMFGDTVLAEVGVCLRKLFRSTDIIGRIGGDEFMVLMRDVKDFSLVLEKAEALNQCLNHTFSDPLGNHRISGSIGVAVYPKDGDNYNDLFQKADVALYNAKRGGRNSCVIYDDTESENLEVANIKAVPAFFPASSLASCCSEMLPYILDVLFHADDINHVLYIILKYIGEQFFLSRVYLFLYRPVSSLPSGFLEWRASGICPECEELLQYAEKSDDLFLKSFQNEILCCSEVANLSEPYRSFYREFGTHATLQVAFREGSALKGCIGFDDCTQERFWTQEEMDILISAARLISTFVEKEETELQLQCAYDSAKTIMESVPGYCYLIDPGTYHILYANQKMLRSAIAPEPDDRCYTVFGNGISPCEDCPLRFAYPVKHKIVRNGMLTLASSSKIQWPECENAVLVCCRELN